MATTKDHADAYRVILLLRYSAAFFAPAIFIFGQ